MATVLVSFHVIVTKIGDKTKLEKEYMFWLMTLEGSICHSRDDMGEQHTPHYVGNSQRMGWWH